MTKLPPNAPQPYRRSQLGDKTLAYMRRKGWIDRRTVRRARLDPAPQEG